MRSTNTTTVLPYGHLPFRVKIFGDPSHKVPLYLVFLWLITSLQRSTNSCKFCATIQSDHCLIKFTAPCDNTSFFKVHVKRQKRHCQKMLSNTGVLQNTVAEICHGEGLAFLIRAKKASTWQSRSTFEPTLSNTVHQLR